MTIHNTALKTRAGQMSRPERSKFRRVSRLLHAEIKSIHVSGYSHRMSISILFLSLGRSAANPVASIETMTLYYYLLAKIDAQSFRFCRHSGLDPESSCFEDFSTTAPVPRRGIRRGDGLEFMQVGTITLSLQLVVTSVELLWHSYCRGFSLIFCKA